MWAVNDTDLVTPVTGDAKRAEGYNVYVPADAIDAVKEDA